MRDAGRFFLSLSILLILLFAVNACSGKPADTAAGQQPASPIPATSAGSSPKGSDTLPPPKADVEHTAESEDSLVTPLEGAPPVPEGFASAPEVHAAILAGKVAIIDRNAPVPEGVTEIKDVEYGNIGGTRPLLLDLYLPQGEPKKPRPALVFIHGGGWKSGNRADYRFYTGHFAKLGYVAATISYRLSGEALFPAAIQDAKCAVRWLRVNAEKYAIDPDKIVAIGGSAGGYLSMMLGYATDVPEWEDVGGNEGVSSRVQAVVNLYGPVDLTAEEAKRAGVVKAFLGKTYEEDPDLYVKASPITYLTPDDPPTLILHGTIDETVPIAQADLLARKLKELGVMYLYDRVEGWPHTMDLALDVNTRCRYFIEEFLRRVFGLAPAGQTE